MKMIKHALFFILCASVAYSASANPQNKQSAQNTQNANEILQCNAIFEARKGEIKDSLRELNEKMQNLEVYRNATQNLIEQKQAQLKLQEQALQNKIKEAQARQKQAFDKVAAEKKAIEELIAKNEEILAQIQSTSASKVAKTFSGMKDSKAAPILAELDDGEAAEILTALTPSEASKILAKMDAKRAAELTKVIAKGPPYKKSDDKKDTTQPNPIPGQNPQDEQADDKAQLRFQDNGGF
ncbi:MotE family protein [Helicobacter sp. T3_23-1056]